MILVAGGTGTLGTPLVQTLTASGAAVRVLTRHPGRADALRQEGVEAVVGDVRDPDALAQASAGCASVVSAIHGLTAGRGISPATIDRDANLALIRAATDSNVEHFVLVSVHGASATHPMSLHRMKYAAEQALAGSGLQWTIIRPTPFLETWTNLIGAQLHPRGKALVFGPGNNPINFVPVRDVANAIERSLRDESPRQHILDVIGPANLTFNQIADHLTTTAGTHTKTSHVPLVALRAISLLARPVTPAFARQAHAAVIMNTTDMTAAFGDTHPQPPTTRSGPQYE
jgi:uncharacterized protein YbjT (DUF2867 family)